MSRRGGTEGQHKDPPASLIREIPRDERPRERLLRCGPQALSDAELLAILLRSGRPGASDRISQAPCFTSSADWRSLL